MQTIRVDSYKYCANILIVKDLKLLYLNIFIAYFGEDCITFYLVVLFVIAYTNLCIVCVEKL